MNDSCPPNLDLPEPEERWLRIRDRLLKPRLHWYQFSPRSLLLAFLLSSLPLGWFGSRMCEARRQQKAVEAIGGLVQYDTRKTRLVNPPGWLRRLLGDDFFYDVVYADVGREVDLSCMRFYGDEIEGQITDVEARITDDELSAMRHPDGTHDAARVRAGPPTRCSTATLKE